MRRIIHILAPALLALAAGCNAYRLEPPPGFAQVFAYDTDAHMKTNNNVGLRIRVFDNVEGGTLTFWSRDMVEKLGRRGYALVEQAPAESKNGVVGTRFDFTYTPVGDGEPPRFYTAVLFVSDKYIVVLQLAGLETYKVQYTAELDGILDDLKVRGCKVRTKACKGPQPERLSTPPPVVAKDEAEGEKAGPETAEPETAAPEKATPDKATPDKATPEKATPEKATKATPEKAAKAKPGGG
jgi:hypothetical protein